MNYYFRLLLILIGCQVSARALDTLIFQNGLNGYMGCHDSYLDVYNPDENNGDWHQIFIAN